VAVEWKHRLRETLAETYLELHIAVKLVRLMVQRCTKSEIVVLVNSKEGAVIKIVNETIDIELLLLFA
jgi:hypothetical protein